MVVYSVFGVSRDVSHQVCLNSLFVLRSENTKKALPARTSRRNCNSWRRIRLENECGIIVDYEHRRDAAFKMSVTDNESTSLPSWS